MTIERPYFKHSFGSLRVDSYVDIAQGGGSGVKEKRRADASEWVTGGRVKEVAVYRPRER